MKPSPDVNIDIETQEQKSIVPKTDRNGQIWREVRCPECRKWICDEFIRKGRARFKCGRCGNIFLLVVRPRRQGRNNDKSLNKEQNNGSRN